MDKVLPNGSAHLRERNPLFNDQRNLLERTSLIATLTTHFHRGRRLYFIQAQAGQGKTTLAGLFLRRIRCDFCWHQVRAQDKDPVFFLTSFYRALTNGLAGFSSPLAATMIAKNEVTAPETGRVFSRMLADLAAFREETFFIVIDDLHLLSGAPLGGALIETLIEKMPRNVRLVLISRRPVAEVLPAGTEHLDPVEINNRHLALGRGEIAEFFNTIMHLAIPPGAVRWLHRFTEGWIMGLVLAGRALQNDPAWMSQGIAITADTLPTSDVLDYLVSEFLSDFSPRLYRALLSLSILPEASLSLARGLGHGEKIVGALRKMVSRKDFMRFSDGGREDTIAFHHLFRECLQSLAARKLGEAEQRKILQAAANWFLSHDQPENALHCYLEGRFYPDADGVLGAAGLSLFANNRLAVLQFALEKVPDAARLDFPWLSFFSGIVRLNTDPPGALAYFDAAGDRFRENGNELGELMVLTQMIFYFITVAFRQHQDDLVERVACLFNRHRTKLPLSIEIQALIAISQGFCFFRGDPDRTLRYANEALQLSEENGFDNFSAASRIARAYQFAFQGRWRDFAWEANAFMRLRRSQRVSIFYEHTIDFLEIDILFGWGDFSNYARRKRMLGENLKQGFFRKSAFGPYIRLREIDRFIASGRNSAAQRLLRGLLEDPYVNQRPHLMSQGLQYQALLAAIRNQPSEARQAAARSLKLRDQIGMPLFIAHNRLIVGAAHAVLGETGKSEALFAEALEVSLQMGELAFRAGAYAHRAALRLRTGREEAAGEDVRAFIKCMQQARYRHFFGWIPDVMTAVLRFAVRRDIEPRFARQLAAERLEIAFSEDGEVIPLLSIRTLGTFEIRTAASREIRGQDLTQAQRQLFGLLIASPDHSLSPGTIQLVLWPDSSEKKGRAAFDTLVSRLRGVLNKSLGGQRASSYLRMEKGLLSLSNCRCDADDFMTHTRRGLDHVEKQAFWQADNAYYRAHRLWRGEFMPGIELNEPADQFRAEIQNRYLDTAASWCTLLMESGRLSEAVQLAEQALKVDNINHGLVKTLYRLHSRRNDPVRAATVISNYRKALDSAGFAAEEREGIVESLFED